MSKKPDNPVTALQQLWPTYADFAADVGMSEGTVQVWRHRRTIHPDHFFAIVEGAQRRGIEGVSYERLYALRNGVAA